MPTYDYQCQKCEFEFEREQRITEDPIKTCPKCKSRKAKRLLSASRFILKGGGWYADGYGSTGAAKADGGSESSGDDSSSEKSESSNSSGASDTSNKAASDKKKTSDTKKTGAKKAVKGAS